MAGRAHAALTRTLGAIAAATRALADELRARRYRGAWSADAAAQVAAHVLVFDRSSGGTDDAVDGAVREVLGRGGRAAERLQRTIVEATLPPPSDRLFEELLGLYDRAARRGRGAYYTPDALAAAVVRAADRAAREHLDLGGLADGRVHLLDPAAGTGVFLRSAVKHAASASDDWSSSAPAFASRLTGYEITPAAQAVCRLMLRRAFVETGVSPPEVDVRARDALAAREDEPRANIVVGNPPWAGLGARSAHTDRLLRDPILLDDGGSIPGYYEVDGAPLGERKTWLQDDYVKFLRAAQRTIARAGSGIVALVTNHNWLAAPTFRGVRSSLLETFDHLDVIDLHGNAKRREDENIFPSVAQGSAIIVMTRRPRPASAYEHEHQHQHERVTVRHASLRGTRAEKLSALATDAPFAALSPIHPSAPSYALAPSRRPASTEYTRWPSLLDLFPTRSAGIITARDALLFGLTDAEVLDRISALRDDAASDDDLRARFFGARSPGRGRKGSPRYAAGDSRGWKLPEARAALRADDQWRERVRPCAYRPFDVRPLYYVPWMVDWPREAVMRHGARSLVATRQQSVDEPWTMVAAADGLVESCFLSNRTSEICTVFPILDDAQLPRFHWALAILHATAYRTRFHAELARDYPRVPPPPDGAHPLVALGARLAELYTAPPPRPAEHVLVDHPTYDETTGAVRLDAAHAEPVPPSVWRFRIGAYQPCAKLLKDRRGRPLDLAAYRHAVRSIAAIQAVVAELDVQSSGMIFSASG